MRATTKNGLQVNVVELRRLPLVEVRLVIRGGSAADPSGMPGLSRLVASMLREGSRTHSGARLAAEVEFWGAELDVGSDQESVYIRTRALSEYLPRTLSIVSEIAQRPAFGQRQLERLRRRELERLQLESNQPRFLAAAAFFRALYGEHPYGHIDAGPDTVRSLHRADLIRWHRAHFVPENAFLVVAGDVGAERAIELARRAFAGWAPRKAPRLELAGPVRPVERTIVVVDRPNAAQSIVYFGHMTVARDDPDFAKLLVVNQILGGSAMARLPLDLGQRRGLAQGAYSALLERGQLAPLRAYAAVRTDKTLAAVAGIVEHLRRISSQPPSADELASAKRQLEGSFALRAETAAQVARLVARQRLHGLPDDCWDRFRAQIRAVTNEEALAAARAYVRPETMVLVVVGRATAIADALERWGPVAVLDTDGQLLRAARPVPPPPVPWN
ncbi:MAG: insulinase family protein [Proteobacteria bacterium]|nr:insulinase family protein [Pseudomonadota bacterium]